MRKSNRELEENWYGIYLRRSWSTLGSWSQVMEKETMRLIQWQRCYRSCTSLWWCIRNSVCGWSALFTSLFSPMVANYGNVQKNELMMAEMRFLHRVSGLTLHDRVRSLTVWIEPFLLRIERSRLKWLQGYALVGSWEDLYQAPHWTETLGKMQDPLEKWYLIVVMGTSGDPPEGAGIRTRG